jgi:hypothetical protein
VRIHTPGRSPPWQAGKQAAAALKIVMSTTKITGIILIITTKIEGIKIMCVPHDKKHNNIEYISKINEFCLNNLVSQNHNCVLNEFHLI